MSLIDSLKGRLSLPLIGSPLFIISVPDLVVAQCTAGIIGAMPSLNARPAEQFEEWVIEIKERLAAHDARHPDRPSAPFAINLIVHKSNDRLEHDLAICVRHRVPLIITSLGARPEVNQAVHSYGGYVLHDVINQRFAHSAIDKGADGLVLVCAGAGGHAGALSPFGFMQETRAWFDGPIALSGAVANGRSVLAAEALGADFAYAGSAFIATQEARAQPEQQQMMLECGAEDIIYTNLITGVHGNYMKPSLVRAGLDPDNLPGSDPSKMDFSSDRKKRWKDIWGAGQGIGAVKAVEPAGDVVARWRREYHAARARLGAGCPLVNPAWEKVMEAAAAE
ncbi:nitronate monooxygenase [Belnapia sp. T6]|uniref:Nitronate monooxygenase n=1 Tax=Belnapia mucosa TaxID=2804532 RepID=A0ABS1V6Z7_9PROT|nr:nitronate monooxygenase family protein [Belnapia mucosa]MBL6456936.1 nitronate monooxygenase [Belnapia mucosa]